MVDRLSWTLCLYLKLKKRVVAFTYRKCINIVIRVFVCCFLHFVFTLVVEYFYIIKLYCFVSVV